MIARLRGKRGFTLVELMIVVAIIGVLAALAIYGVRKYITNAKTAEARSGVGRMAKDGAAAFGREGMQSSVVALGDVAEQSNRLCSSSGNTVPAALTEVAAQKYQSALTEWQTGSAWEGWQCLHFSMEDPQYYMYGYTATNEQGDDGSFIASAQGDLDGDGTPSEFTLSGQVEDSGGAGLQVRLAPNMGEVNPEE